VSRILLLAALLALVSATPAHAQKKKRKRPPEPVKVQLLAINDFHGALEASPTATIARNSLRRRDRVPAGGAEYLATHVRLLERRNPNTLVVSAGDLVGASPLLSALFHDEPTIEAMNTIGLDLNAVGNHEFDEGASELLRLQRGGCHASGCLDGDSFAGARFRFLAANVLSRRTNRPLFAPYAIRELGGVRIGFIGMTLEGTPDMVPPSVSARLRFADEARTANRYVRVLRRRKVQAIVVLLHEGDSPVKPALPDECPGLSGPLEDIIRRTSPEVDVFLTGHTHAAYNCIIDRRRVTSAGSFGRLITRIDLTIERRHDDVVRAEAHNWIVGRDVMRAPDISALIARYAHFADPLRQRLIGRLAEGASRRADDSGEREMGNLVADAQLQATASDAAFVNPGEIRAGLSAGDVTFGRAFASQPFGTSLVTMTLTGAQLYELLKEQWCGRPAPRVLQPSSGITYRWSAYAAFAIQGKPCDGAANPVSDLRLRGVPVSADGDYRVTVSSLLAGGFNRFDVLAAGKVPIGGPDDTAALEAHLAPSLSGDPLVPPATDRIERVP
jgi:5'-nucleotidase